MTVLRGVGAETRELPLLDHLQDPLEAVRGIRGDRVGLGHAHEPGDVPLLDVLHQEQLDGLSLTLAEEDPCRVQVLDVVQGVGDAIRSVDCVDVLALKERPERFEVLEQRPQHANRQQEPTGALLRRAERSPVAGAMG